MPYTLVIVKCSPHEWAMQEDASQPDSGQATEARII
jgi:hypothetical protein